MALSKQTVRAYWEASPCGSSNASASRGTPEFFAQVDRERDRLEPFIAGFAEFERWRDKQVLEIGIGLGSDFVRFVRAGAAATGVDLTQAAVALVEQRLALEGLTAELAVADAEELPFSDASFDLVYSWGVLHHTPETARAIAEVHRLLAPGGEARIMLYSRRSWVAYGLWARYALATGHPRRSLADVVSSHMESDGTKAYTTPELRALFAPFRSVTITPFLTPYDRRVAGPLAGVAGNRLGWFLGIRAIR